MFAQIVPGIFGEHRKQRMAARSQDPPKLHEPRINQMKDVGEDGDPVNEMELAVLKREVQISGAGYKLERRRQVPLGPADQIGVLIDPPKFALPCVLDKVTQHATG